MSGPSFGNGYFLGETLMKLKVETAPGMCFNMRDAHAYFPRVGP
jgi:hypothetical protein